jgi:hypothetical protein
MSDSDSLAGAHPAFLVPEVSVSWSIHFQEKNIKLHRQN